MERTLIEHEIRKYNSLQINDYKHADSDKYKPNLAICYIHC